MAEQEQTMGQVVADTKADKIIEEGKKLSSSIASWDDYLKEQYFKMCDLSREHTITGIDKA